MFYWAQDGASFVEGLNRINLPLNSLINHVKEMLDGIAIPNFYGKPLSDQPLFIEVFSVDFVNNNKNKTHIFILF